MKNRILSFARFLRPSFTSTLCNVMIWYTLDNPCPRQPFTYFRQWSNSKCSGFLAGTLAPWRRRLEIRRYCSLLLWATPRRWASLKRWSCRVQYFLLVTVILSVVPVSSLWNHLSQRIEDMHISSMITFNIYQHFYYKESLLIWLCFQVSLKFSWKTLSWLNWITIHAVWRSPIKNIECCFA